ncbi:hypothetical protein [Allokutzneria oryzae]|uniref:Uncharacterized protein n=1 Tax=Allokutzneria oryzae TaxID=1378989 RepID=A0ABV5ZXA4_9PSEU
MSLLLGIRRCAPFLRRRKLRFLAAALPFGSSRVEVGSSSAGANACDSCPSTDEVALDDHLVQAMAVRDADALPSRCEMRDLVATRRRWRVADETAAHKDLQTSNEQAMAKYACMAIARFE